MTSLRTTNMPSQRGLMVMAIHNINCEFKNLLWKLDNDPGCNVQQINARIAFLKQ